MTGQVPVYTRLDSGPWLVYTGGMTTTNLMALIERRLAGREVTDRQLRAVPAYVWDHFGATLSPAGEAAFLELDRRRRAMPAKPERRVRPVNIDDHNEGWGA
jgi:hypothetical protein